MTRGGPQPYSSVLAQDVSLLYIKYFFLRPNGKSRIAVSKSIIAQRVLKYRKMENFLGHLSFLLQMQCGQVTNHSRFVCLEQNRVRLKMKLFLSLMKLIIMTGMASYMQSSASTLDG